MITLVMCVKIETCVNVLQDCHIAAFYAPRWEEFHLLQPQIQLMGANRLDPNKNNKKLRNTLD